MAFPLTLSSLPLFPLQTVLFPGGVLALRVFEVRYLDMVRKCQLAGAPFGVVTLTSGQEVRQAGAAPEQFASTGTLAGIEQLQAPQPGLLTLQVRGAERFHIRQQSRLAHGLWIADVEQIDADLPVAIPASLRAIALALAQVLTRLHDQGRAPGQSAPTPEQLDDCGWVANRWCELLPAPLTLKQQLMALQNPLQRLELVGDVLDRTGIAT